MPRGRGNRTIVGGGRPRRPMDWICGDLNVEGFSNPDRVCKWLVPPSELREGFTDPTLMSTMVWLTLIPQGQPTSTAPIAGFGIIVVFVFDDAEPVGDACPGPITDCSADWVYLNYYLATPGIGGGVSMGTELDRRSQAKRRLGNDKGILFVFEAFGASQNFFGYAHVRCLIKE